MPRFHVTWGTGPGVVAPFERRVRAAATQGLVTFAFRHRVDELVVTDGAVTRVRGAVLEASDVARDDASSRVATGEFELTAQAVLLTSGGIGANHALVRKNWPARLGTAPEHMISGVPAHVDGRAADRPGRRRGGDQPRPDGATSRASRTVRVTIRFWSRSA